MIFVQVLTVFTPMLLCLYFIPIPILIQIQFSFPWESHGNPVPVGTPIPSISKKDAKIPKSFVAVTSPQIFPFRLIQVKTNCSNSCGLSICLSVRSSHAGIDSTLMTVGSQVFTVRSPAILHVFSIPTFILYRVWKKVVRIQISIFISYRVCSYPIGYEHTLYRVMEVGMIEIPVGPKETSLGRTSNETGVGKTEKTHIFDK